jgi:diguanylate cyclase (GGDEF)-like protein
MGRDNSLLRFLIGLPIPGCILLAAAWAVQNEPTVRNAAAPYALYFGVGALAAAVLLCWYHEQSRVLSVTLAVALTMVALLRPPGDSPVAVVAAMILLPLNIALFAVWQDKAVGAFRGVPKLGVVLAQAAAVAWLDTQTAHRVGSMLGGRAVAVSFAIAALVVLTMVFKRRGKVEQGLFWVLSVMFLAVTAAAQPDLLSLYAGAAGVILVLTVLEHGDDLAYRDELTGLLGRRAFNMMGGLGRRYAIAICDVDHFKRFNDTYGHEAGDQVLRMVASKLSQVGGGGRVFRHGGEEFLLVFRGRSSSEAVPFAESVRRAIADTAFVLRSQDRPARKPLRRVESNQNSLAKATVRITISIGLADRSTRHSTPELVLDAADAALYEAKAAGRNCIRVVDATPAAIPASTRTLSEPA